MTWVAWRQHRLQMLWGAAAMTVLALFLVPTGLSMAHFFSSSGLARCFTTAGADCGSLSQAFDNRYSGLAFLIPLFMAAPVLVGMFYGAPLIAREMDGGTYRLAWTQGVTRLRWLVTKLMVVVGSALAGSVALAYLVTWWSRPLVANEGSLRQGVFDLRGIVPIAYTIFAVMLGVAVGSIVKKTLPAIGVTLVGYAGVRVLIDLYIRPHYMAARSVIQPLVTKGIVTVGRAPNSLRGAWVISNNTVDRLGNVVSRGGGFDFGYLASRCPAVAAAGPFPRPGVSDPLPACLQHLGLRESLLYQPASRFWTFQWIEFAIFIALALGLFAFTRWRTKRLS
ncbi:MAG: transporter [Solirubrobacteraceae bacterium]